ncbi:MAG: hypothetical protein GX465_07180 [Acidobacteria bacterium]|nr:hypothetical protein [Acidobacteriota bacterium]
MAFCRTAEFLYDALPLRTVRGWLIRGHMERCPRCQARLLDPEEARELLVRPKALGPAPDLWGRIAVAASRAAAFERPERARPGFVLRWASALALTAFVAATGLWMYRQVDRAGFDALAAAPPQRLEIAYVRVGGRPAQTFVYQPQGTDSVFVWAERTP